MLNNLKLLLGIEDTSRDDLLNLILSETGARLSNRFLGGNPVPTDLQYVVIGVSVIRYNRIGSEGMDSQSIEGESLHFNDDDFAPYVDDIAGYLSQQDDIPADAGIVRFL